MVLTTKVAEATLDDGDDTLFSTKDNNPFYPTAMSSHRRVYAFHMGICPTQTAYAEAFFIPRSTLTRRLLSRFRTDRLDGHNRRLDLPLEDPVL